MRKRNLSEHLENNLTFCFAVLGTYLAFCFQGFTKGFFLFFKKIIYINLAEGTFFFLDLITRQVRKSFEDINNLYFFLENLWTDVKIVFLAIGIHWIIYQIKNKHLVMSKDLWKKYLSSLLSFVDKYAFRILSLILIPHFCYVILLPDPYLFLIIFIPYWSIAIPIFIYKSASSDLFLKVYSLFFLMFFLILTPSMSASLGHSFAEEVLKKDFEIFDMFSLKGEGTDKIKNLGRVLMVNESATYYYDYSTKMITTLDKTDEKMDYISPMAN